MWVSTLFKVYFGSSGFRGLILVNEVSLSFDGVSETRNEKKPFLTELS